MRLANKQTGFTVIEVLIGLVLSVFVLLIAFDITNVTNKTNARTRQYAEANSLAFAKMQEYEIMEFTDIPPPNYTTNLDNEVEDFSAEVTAESGGDIKDPIAKVYSSYADSTLSLKLIRVSLDFQLGSERRLVEYATYIQLGGLGR